MSDVKVEYVHEADFFETDVLAGKSQSPMIPVVRLEQHEAALAEKEQEIERLTILKGHWEELANQYMDRIQMGEHQRDTLMGKAVELANGVIHCSFYPGRIMRAKAFLARPDVCKWQARQKETP